jgi:hypothetical protein
MVEIKSMDVKFNINDKVKVRLNDYGIELLKKEHDDLKIKIPDLSEFILPITDCYGYVEYQMWQLFEHFGKFIDFTSKLPFDTEMIIHAA